MHVFVGLSGGVDSAVSAALLKSRGFQVTGAFIKIWSPEFIECTWREDRLDAMRAAAAIGIAFEEVDLSQEYLNGVVGKMTADYARGVTPNPDVLCNRAIKFDAFARWALERGADKIATGHYARLRDAGGEVHLLRGVDAQKDQSYFLHAVPAELLARAMFPIGELTKPQVRGLAKRFGLPNAKRPDSQGLCFVGEITLPEFLSRFIPVERGDVLDTSGKKIGVHEGAALYTVGQRHGFSLEKSASPHFVVSLDVQENTITVSTERSDAATSSVEIRSLNWISAAAPGIRKVDAQARYREAPFRAQIESYGAGALATFESPHIAAPGQSLALYDGERCLGGGEIASRVHSA